jgi:proteic killer suppression protein
MATIKSGDAVRHGLKRNVSNTRSSLFFCPLTFNVQRYTVYGHDPELRLRGHTGSVRNRQIQAVLGHCGHSNAQASAAQTLAFLRSPPGNRLEALKRRRSGQYSIRVNDQFRVCFRWTEAGQEDVEIVDYH